MTSVLLKRGVTFTAGFLVTVLVGVVVPLTLLLVAPFAAGEAPGSIHDLFVTPLGFGAMAIFWLAVIVGGMWLGLRNPGRSFFRGSFLGAFIIVGCLVVLAIAKLIGRLG